jgi:1-acyl-sn-glycerol-3-phosphate acyltransferase
LEFIPPDYSPSITQLVYAGLPVWMRFKTSIARVETQHLERLVRLYEQFAAGKVRLLLAFRHPSVDDPVAIGYTLSRLIPRLAQQMDTALPRPIHAHFMYDRGIPMWAGAWMGWMYAKLGGTSILRGKLDRPGLRSARDLLSDGPFPLMVAPEGGINGHNEIVSPLEPGVAQLGFWCAEDLQKANRSETALIVPIGVQYTYVRPEWSALEELLAGLEAECGLSQSGNGEPEQLYQRLLGLGEFLLDLMEQHYQRFYHQTLPPVDASTPQDRFARRLQNLLNAALNVAERHFELEPRGSVIDRCHRVEQAAWDTIYRDDLNFNQLSLLERELADRVAAEAEFYLWHKRLVESFVAVTGRYIQDKPTFERFAETVLIAWETVARIAGERNPFNRPRLGPQVAHITIGEAISVSDRWADYSASRRAAKQAVEDLTQTLQTALEALIF